MHKGREGVVGAHTGVEKVGGEFGFTEGPVGGQTGVLLFSDLPSNAIMRWHPQEGVSEFRKPSGYDANNAPPGTHIGSNGLKLGTEGRLVIREPGNRRVTRLDKEGKLTVLAGRNESSRLNTP